VQFNITSKNTTHPKGKAASDQLAFHLQRALVDMRKLHVAAAPTSKL
jgi:hypothetical protein